MRSRSNNLSSGFSSSPSPPESFSFTFRFQLDFETQVRGHYSLPPTFSAPKLTICLDYRSSTPQCKPICLAEAADGATFICPLICWAFFSDGDEWWTENWAFLPSLEDFFMFSFNIVPRGKRATSGIRLLLNALSVLWDCRAAFTYQFRRKIPPRVSIFVLCQHASTRRLFYVLSLLFQSPCNLNHTNI